MLGVQITGLGKAVPEKELTNDEMSTFVDTSDEWIKSRTGIEKRHVATTETTSSLAAAAARMAMEKAGLTPDDIELLIVATVSPDTSMPSTACQTAKILGIKNACCFDVTAACSGFIYASSVAVSMMKTMGYKKALVIGAEVLSKALDWQDRGTCVLFGDGAGAVVYELSEKRDQILAVDISSKPEGADLITLPVYANDPKFYEGPEEKRFIKMDGRSVYVFSTTTVPESIEKLLIKAGLKTEDIKMFILHQANSRIMDSAARRLKADKALFFKNLQNYGNTSGASIPMALYDASSQLKTGDRIILCGFGAGLTWGTMLIEW